MSMRWVVVLLLAANLGYFAWARGSLAMFGAEPERFSETEPQRLQQQVRPQMLQIRKNAPAKP